MRLRVPLVSLALAICVANPAFALDCQQQGKPCAPPSTSRGSVAVAESIMRSYVGEYSVSARMAITVSLEGGLLRAHPTGDMERVMRGLSETRFFIEGSTLELSFTKDAVGAVTGILVHQRGRDLVGRKVR